MSTATIVTMIFRALDIIVDVINMAPKAKAQYASVSALVRQMGNENRDPTPEEWAALDAVTEDNHNRIQNS